MTIKKVRFGIGLIVLAITLLTFPVIERSFKAYHKTLFQTLTSFSVYHTRAITPGSGEDSVPSQALEIRSIVRQLNLPSYRLSVNYSKNGWHYQQTVVSLWPIKLEPDSPNLFQLIDEPIEKNCTVAFKGKESTLVHCK